MTTEQPVPNAKTEAQFDYRGTAFPGPVALLSDLFHAHFRFPCKPRQVVTVNQIDSDAPRRRSLDRGRVDARHARVPGKPSTCAAQAEGFPRHICLQLFPGHLHLLRPVMRTAASRDEDGNIR